MRMFMKLLTGTLLLASMAALWSCGTSVVCGKGTAEINGECVAGNTPPEGQCGAGSEWDPATNQCILEGCNGADCGLCGPNTQLTHNDAGMPICIGTGGTELPCDQPLPCPSPVGDRFMICGRLVDTETGQFLTDTLADPRGLDIGFYDAIAFATNPATMPEFVVHPDRCGRYTSADATHPGVMVPATSFLVVGTEDPTGATFALTGIGIEGIGGDQAVGVRTYATRKTTEAKWGNNLITTGAYLGIFIDESKPDVGIYPGPRVAGVELVVDGTPVGNSAKSYYFSDADSLLTTVDGALTVTGANGGALYTDQSLTEFSGNKTGCTFTPLPAGTLPGALFVQEKLGTCN